MKRGSEMKKRIAAFFEVEEEELKPIAICTLIAIITCPVLYYIVFAPIGWWL